MNPFLLRPRERLSDWKVFRQSLSGKSEAQQLQEVARYWAQAPRLKLAYSCDEPQAWTSPWEMIVANRWCRFSTAIGMEFTLRLAGWDPRRMALKFIVDYDLQETFFVLEIDNRYWLNHEYQTVLEIPKTPYDVLCAWEYVGSHYVAVQDAFQDVAA